MVVELSVSNDMSIRRKILWEFLMFQHQDVIYKSTYITLLNKIQDPYIKITIIYCLKNWYYHICWHMLLRLVSDKPWRKMCDEKYGQSNFMVGHSSIFLSLLKNDLEMLRMIMFEIWYWSSKIMLQTWNKSLLSHIIRWP